MAAGRGTRLGADRPKALVPLGHGPDAAPLVTHALRGVLSCPDLSDVVVVAPPDRMPELAAAVDLTAVDPSGVRGTTVRVRVVAGGAERSDSVAAGLAALPHDVGIVLVHDAARALTPPVVFERVVAAVRHGHRAVVPALPVADTIKMVDARDHVVSTPDRSALRAVQTPQGFLRETLERAHRETAASDTDDAGLVEGLGDAVFVVVGDPRSTKVTEPEDLARVSSMIGPGVSRATAGPSGPDVRDGVVRSSLGAASTACVAGDGAGGHWRDARVAGDDAGDRRPVLLVLGGLPGTGKTTLARSWATGRAAAHVRVDSIEQALVRAGTQQVGTEGSLDARQVRLDGSGSAQRLGPVGYAVAYAVAADQLALGVDVVADSVNPLPVTRQAWREVAEAAGARVLEVELTCAAAEHRERVETRMADIPGHEVPDWSAVQAADYVPWPQADLCLDTSGTDVSDLVTRIEDAL